MRAVTTVLLAAALLAAPSIAAEVTNYGKELTDAEQVALVELLGNPDKYVGKTVRVKGRITDVCPRMGCWIDIADKSGEQSIRFKVKDGEIVFPTEAKGKRVTAEGVFTAIELDHEEAVAYARHMAEEKDQPFDPAEVTGPMTLYRLNGLGAVVK